MGILAKEKTVWIEEKIDSYDYIKMRNVYLSKNNQNEKACVKQMKICTTNKTDKRLTSFLEKELQRIEQENKGYDQKILQHGTKASLQKGKSLVFSF